MHVLLAPMLEKGDGSAGAGLSAETPGGRHRFPPSGPLHGGGSENLQQKLALLADAAEEHIDWPRLLALCEKEPPALPVQPETPPARVRIAVAQDEAFCFTYAETLEAFGTPGQRWSFSAPSATRLCREKHRRAVSARRLPGTSRKRIE